MMKVKKIVFKNQEYFQYFSGFSIISEVSEFFENL